MLLKRNEVKKKEKKRKERTVALRCTKDALSIVAVSHGQTTAGPPNKMNKRQKF